MKKIVLVMVLAGLIQSLHGQLQEAIEQIRSDYKLMGLSVATVCDGKVTATYHAGLRDYERNLPVDVNTKYRIASISKLVMTTALMRLCDQKLLDLDEDVSTYLGFKLRNPGHPVTPITVSADFKALECPKCLNNDPDYFTEVIAVETALKKAA